MRLIFLIFIILILIFLFFKFNYQKMKYVKCDIDNNFYLVRDLPNKIIAVNMLGTIKKNINILVDYLDEHKDTKYKENKLYITRLKKRLYNINIVENTGIGRDTSYTINKGDELVLCLRSRVKYDEFHDINLIQYVVLHEISHVASPFYEPKYNNHGPIFKKIFQFITSVAIELGLYNKIEFNKQPAEYCGITINDSII